ncbi:hypothetical protein PBI_CAMILLE_67 [Microbacterium phage Camille]|nr:hypothetical protein PBI_CAMILLE_67 [Microbacterium phage Camille]
MADKAIKVTNENREELKTRFQQEATGVEPAVGYYLVAQFGADDRNYEMISSAVFNQKYEKGVELRNGFFEAVPKNG